MPNSRVARNFLLLSAGELAAKVCTFWAYTSLGRGLGPARYGDIEFAISSTLFFALFVQFGLGAYGARELAKAPDKANELIAEMCQLRLWTGAAAFGAMALLALLVDKGTDSRLLLLAYGVTLLEVPGLLIWYFQGREQMANAAWTSLVRHVVFAGLALTVMDASRPLWIVGIFEIIALGCTVVVGALLAGRLPLPRWNPAGTLSRLRASAGIGLAELAWAGLWFLPVVVYGFQRSDASVGWLGSAHRATLAIHTFVWWYFFNLLPVVSRCAPDGVEELTALLGRSMRLTLWGGFFTAVCMTALARPLVGLAYGDAFGPAGPLLALLIWTIPLSVVSGHYRNVLIGFDRQRALLFCTGLSALASAVTTAYLASSYGAQGAVMGLLIGNAVLAASTAWAVNRSVMPVGSWTVAWAPTASAAVACAVLWFVRENNPYVAGAAAATVFAALFAAVERKELAKLGSELAARI
ncbi:MAG: oligosaccharide flippase family protein [Acidobacteria bacterium]|nr:oligosaccharide flippase family protein [Acidobacteriota bacterium]MDA1237018.1 oligosaccharide flippase family protein [Acidobacteriota bacterium]